MPWLFSDFSCFDMSLLLLTVTRGGYLISIAYCLFSLKLITSTLQYVFSGVQCQPYIKLSLTRIHYFFFVVEDRILVLVMPVRGHNFLFTFWGMKDSWLSTEAEGFYPL